MNFDSFLGNSRIVDRLRTKLRGDRFPHGLIFSGPEGVGKHTLAVMIAKALNCEKPAQSGAPGEDASDRPLFCNHCSHCRKIEGGVHPDVLTIGVQEDASEIKISQSRRILSLLGFQPLEGRNKVFIIDPANLMNDHSANALLKGLEEPPHNSFFILIAVNVHELLLTVRSRCQIYNFSPLTLDEIRRHGIEDELLVRWSQGSIGRARSVDIGALKEQREFLLAFLETVITAKDTEFRDMLAATADLARSKQDFASHLGLLSVLLADLLYMTEGMPEKIVNVDVQDRIGKLSARAGRDRLIHMAEFMRFIEQGMKNYVNPRMLADVFAIESNEAAAKILHDNPRKSR